jgi:hypothetical protein
MTTEQQKRHYYYFYGTIVSGYGPSMDPHRCGHPDEPCITVVREREISDWSEVSREIKGDYEKFKEGVRNVRSAR